jgi:hypothetical protein
MNSAEYVECQIDGMKAQGMVVDQLSWEIAKLCIGWPYVFGDRGCYCTPSNRTTAYNRTAAGTNKDNIKKRCQVLNGSKGFCAGCKWFPEGKKVREFDCRGFTYWVLLQASGWKLMGAGCTSQWDNESNWKAKGELSESLPPKDTIACVFWYKKDEKGRRTKTLEHTGLYYNGETIECSNGVQYIDHLHKKWEVWAVPACSGGVIPPAPVPPTPTPTHKTIRRGSTGPDVVECQQDLITLGYDLSPYGADGKFGAKTETAVKAFQTSAGLPADGVVGKNTWAALDEAVKPSPTPTTPLYTVSIPHLTEYQADALIQTYSGAWKTKE